jgi:hypothetical protein
MVGQNGVHDPQPELGWKPAETVDDVFDIRGTHVEVGPERSFLSQVKAYRIIGPEFADVVEQGDRDR